MDQLTLALKDLTVGYGMGRNSKEILSHINVGIYPGQMVALIGANGSGKSTLLRTLAGLQPVLDGEFWINSKNFLSLTPKEIASHISLVLTDRIQTGYLTVGDLVSMGRHPYTDWRGRMSETDVNAVLGALAATGLEMLIHANLQELSDGQKQKAMIARAIAQDGDLMLLDEPLIHLDVTAKWEIMNLLRQTVHNRHKSMVIATHELDLSLKIADQIWLIDHDGALITGTPEDLVLEGRISQIFNHRQYSFDEGSGGFSIKSNGPGITVVGNGNMSLWTRRAVERAGFKPVTRDGIVEIRCTFENSQRQWRVVSPDKDISCKSIGELIDFLNKLKHS